jgi:phosphoglycolate phosphatase
VDDELTLTRAIVFDFDGTLFHFLIDYMGMRNAVRTEVIASGVPASKFYEDERIRDVVNKMLDYSKSEGWSDSKVSSLMKKVDSIMDEYEWASAQGNTPLDGAEEVLRRLRGERYKTGLLTNNSRRSIEFLLEKYSFSRFFDAIVTRNELVDVNNLKPSPVGLKRVLGELEVEPNEAMYVGDSVVDVKAALSVGVTPIFVTTGYSTEKEVREAYPDVLIINDLRQLLTFLNQNET